MSHIRAKAVCLFHRHNHVLLAEGFDPTSNETFLTAIGGGIEFGEKSIDAAAREVLEELGEEVTALTLLGVLENIFTFDGKAGHEMVFVYEGQFSDTRVYQREVLQGVETSGHRYQARWYEVSAIDKAVYPRGVIDFL